MNKTLLSVMAATTLLLVGCAGPAETASPPSPPPTPTVAASPSPSATPEPTKPALEDLVISPEGLGPLRVGHAPPATDPAVDILIYDPNACDFVPEWDPTYVPSGDLGMWVSNYGQDPSTNELGPFGVFVRDGIVDTIGIYDARIKTAAGAHLGMTREQLLAVYPTGIELETENYGLDTYRLRGSTGDLIFTLWEGETGGFTVNQINASHPGFSVPLGGSDYGVFGICFGP